MERAADEVRDEPGKNEPEVKGDRRRPERDPERARPEGSGEDDLAVPAVGADTSSSRSRSRRRANAPRRNASGTSTPASSYQRSAPGCSGVVMFASIAASTPFHHGALSPIASSPSQQARVSAWALSSSIAVVALVTTGSDVVTTSSSCPA